MKKGGVVHESPKAHVPFSETEQEENAHTSMGLRSEKRDWHSELCSPVGPSFLRIQWVSAKMFLRLAPKTVVIQDGVSAGDIYMPFHNYVPYPCHLKMFSESLILLPF